MAYAHRVHFANGEFPLCGHPCWNGPHLTWDKSEVTCSRCLNMLAASTPEGDEVLEEGL